MLLGTMTLRTVAAATAFVLLAAGCGATKEAAPSQTGLAQGTNHPTATGTTTPAPSPSAEAPKKFGARFTYQDGLVIQLGPPIRFTPSQYAAAEKAPAYVSFKVTIINGTQAPYDPSVFQVTVQSSDTEASEVIDMDRGINGSPATSVLRRREATFLVGFAVRNPKDLVAQVRPGFEYDTAIFTS